MLRTGVLRKVRCTRVPLPAGGALARRMRPATCAADGVGAVLLSPSIYLQDNTSLSHKAVLVLRSDVPFAGHMNMTKPDVSVCL